MHFTAVLPSIDSPQIGQTFGVDVEVWLPHAVAIIPISSNEATTAILCFFVFMKIKFKKNLCVCILFCLTLVITLPQLFPMRHKNQDNLDLVMCPHSTADVPLPFPYFRY